VGVKIGSKGRGLQRGARVRQSSIELLIREHTCFEYGELLKYLSVFDPSRGYTIAAEELALIRVSSTEPDVDIKHRARAWW
jgi:hypothetical protein